MQSKIQPVLKALEEAGVRYLVVGGVAVVLHGHLRTTMDLDLVVDLSETNLRKALRALAGLGFQPRLPVTLELFADPTIRASWVRDKHMTVFSLWHPADPSFVVDLFAEAPFDFELAYQGAVRVSLPETEARVLSLEDLVEMKTRVGRSRDDDDVRALRTLHELGANGSERG